ncbi:hypothetical protein JW960_17525 [candidate division KSB1 bacterium]|nr:hypothetical protein [candidate division KSB1 bacterium]
MVQQTERTRGFFWGGVLIFFGFLLLLDQWDIISFGDLWPLAIIAVGVWMILKPHHTSHKHPGFSHGMGDQHVNADTSKIHYTNSMGDLNVTANSANFTGGNIRTTFGSVKVDLSAIRLAEGEQLLEVGTTFGDIKITAPTGIPLMILSTNTAGDMKVFEEKRSGFKQEVVFQTPDYDAATTRLKIVTSQVFGDLKVW